MASFSVSSSNGAFMCISRDKNHKTHQSQQIRHSQKSFLMSPNKLGFGELWRFPDPLTYSAVPLLQSRLKAQLVVCNTNNPIPCRTLSSEVGNFHLKFPATDHSHLMAFPLSKKIHSSLKETAKVYCGPIRELKDHEEKPMLYANDCVQEDPFTDLKHRFLNFKKENFLEKRIQYETLAEGQAPKFMVIACADSRVCPSKILGFQPGEAFTLRNIANLVPPFQHGASETTAALEFAVNTLEVPNLLVVGHSRCGGIRALMSEKDKEKTRSFIGGWVSIAKSARLSTKAAVGNLSFDKQCAHCEKESINGSLLNLLGYPWIEKRVSEGKLSLHGGYYDFVNCTFEKWTLVYREGLEGGSKYAINDRYFWS